MSNIAFKTIDWSDIIPSVHPGTQGEACWKTVETGDIRMRIVEYSPGYIADHWCHKGHIVHCLEGSFSSELAGGEKFLLTKGMSYIVSDDMSSHRSVSVTGVKLLIVDGDFLKTRANDAVKNQSS